MIYCYKLTISYDGSNYNGWQIQPNGKSIQEEIEKALLILLKEEIRIIGSGRTDACVHALGQVANFTTSQSIDILKFTYSLNSLLPCDIRIKNITQVASTFHAQYSAISKTYQYHVYTGKVLNPFKRLYVWHLHRLLDLNLLCDATKKFLGEHDFASFANVGSSAKDSIRNLMKFDVDLSNDEIIFTLKADGFLYKMVRNLVGFVIEIASHKRPITDIKKVLLAKDRRQAGSAAPPQGLFLVEVDYPKELSLISSNVLK